MKTIAKRCREIQAWLPEFMRDRLGAAATGEVQGHLLTCETCSEIFGDLLMKEVESGAEPLPDLPLTVRIPPLELYDAYLQQRRGRLGRFWNSVRRALDSANNQAREQAREEIGKISDALTHIFVPMTMTPVPVRGATRTRGAGGLHLSSMTAEVLSSDLAPLGRKIEFSMEEPPRIEDGCFRLRISTQALGYEGDSVICTLTLPEIGPISFSGNLEGRENDGAWETNINEEGLLSPAGNIAPELVVLTVIKK